MYLAILETGNFTFHTIADRADVALEQLEAAWQRHAEQTGAWALWEEMAQDVNVYHLEAGDVLRDGSII